MINNYIFLGDSLIFGYGVKPKIIGSINLKISYDLNIL